MQKWLMVCLALAACETPEEVPEPEVEIQPNLAAITIDPSPVDFGSVFVGESVEILLRIDNASADPIQLKDLALNPAGGPVYIDGDVHDELIYGVWIEPGDSYAFPITFEPESLESYEGALDMLLPSDVRKSVRVLGQPAAP